VVSKIIVGVLMSFAKCGLPSFYPLKQFCCCSINCNLREGIMREREGEGIMRRGKGKV